MSNFKKILAVATVSLFAVVAVAGSAGAQMFSWSRSLSQGSTGADVMNLQKFLNLCADTQVSVYGAGAPGMETSTFGPATKAAVIKFQMKNQVYPTAGYFGPLSQAKAAQLQASGNVCGGVTTPGLPAGCTTTAGFSMINGAPCSGGSNLPAGCQPGYMFSPTTGASCTGGSTPTTPGSLSGGAGALNDVDLIASINNEEVGEGEEAVKIVGLDVEADDGSDLALTAVRVEFEAHASTTGSDDLDDYAEEVTLWLGNTQIASSDVDDFNESSGVWSRSMNVSGARIDAGDTEKLYLAVTALNNIDSSDLGSNNSWMATIANIRFQDAQTAVITDSTTGDLPAGRDFNFVSFSSSADTDLRISKSSDSPEDGIVIVDDSDETDNVLLLAGTLRLDGNSDATLDELPVTFTTSGGSNLNVIASNLILVLGDEEYSENVASALGSPGATITFDDLDFDIEAGDTVDFEIRADINGTDDYNEGDTITASITSDNRSAMDVENEEGDQIADSDRSGTATGEAQEFRSEGISVSLVSVSDSVNSDATLGTYTIKFKVTAVGDEAYVGTAVTKYTYALENASSGATTAGVSAAITNGGGSGNSTSTTTGGNWKINEGTSVTLTLQVFGNGGSLAGGAYRAVLSAIGWDSSDADAALANSYTSNMDDFHTDYEQIL